MTPDRQFSDQRLADLYDLGNAGSEDRDFYLSLAGDTPKDILDLGCGTGVLTRSYARAGHRVVGVDPAEAMLKVARRASPSDGIEWVQASAEGFRSDQRFDLIIMTGHAFQVLLTDEHVDAALQTMRRHLKPNGVAVFESRNPNIDWDTVWAREYVMETSSGDVRAARRMTDASRAPEYLSFAWDYHFSDDLVTSESTLRFMSWARICEAARQAGLQLESCFGDWDETEFDPVQSREMIFKFRLAQ